MDGDQEIMKEQLSPLGRFERILLASDGSTYCADAESTAMAMAEKWGSLLQLVTVVVTNPQAEEAAPALMLKAEEDASVILERLRREARRRGIEVETVMRRGPDPHVEIAAAAEERVSDVIVMGRRGKRGLLRRMIGDATARIVGSARCAVLMVPEGAKAWRSRILLATDGSRFADAAAVSAAKIAALDRLPVTVISVVRENFSPDRAAQASEAAERVAAHLARHGIEVDKTVQRGSPGPRIIATAAERDSDLIVMGTHGRTGWERVLVGSVTESVMNDTKLPVLAVKL